MSATRILSPSMRPHVSDPKHKPRAVGLCFEECDQLPQLLVHAAIGDIKVKHAISIYAQLNHQFATLVVEEVQKWCTEYEQLKQTTLRAWSRQCHREFYMAREAHLAMFKRAFGGTYGCRLSKYTPRVYMDILACRCSICNTSMKGLSDTHSRAEHGFTHSHSTCESKYCVHIPNDTMVGAPLMSNTQLINFQRHMDIDAIAAVMWHYKPFADLEGLAAKTSKLTQRINDKAYGITLPPSELEGTLKRWVRPHPFVADEDTLFGAAGITTKMEHVALQWADSGRDVVRARADARRARARDEEKDEARLREGQLRVQMVIARLPWHTPNALKMFSPHMLYAIKYSDFVDDHIGTPTQVVRMASYVADILASPERVLSQGTVNFFLKTRLIPAPLQGWTFRGAAWSAHSAAFRKLVILIETFDASRFKIECLASRNTRQVEDLDSGSPSRPGLSLPLLNARAFTTMFVVTTYWPGMRERTAQINVAWSDETLFRLRATTGLSEEVDLEAAFEGLSHTGAVPLERRQKLENCATTIVGAALNTHMRTHVLHLMALTHILQNLIENTLPEEWHGL